MADEHRRAVVGRQGEVAHILYPLIPAKAGTQCFGRSVASIKESRSSHAPCLVERTGSRLSPDERMKLQRGQEGVVGGLVHQGVKLRGVRDLVILANQPVGFGGPS